MMRVAEYSRDCLKALRETTGIEYENRAKGTLQVFRSEAQLEAVQRDIQVLEECGVGYALLDREDLLKSSRHLHMLRINWSVVCTCQMMKLATVICLPMRPTKPKH